MLVLFETSTGYAIFKVLVALQWPHVTVCKPLVPFIQLLDERKLEQVDDLYEEFESPEKASKMSAIVLY